MGGRLAKDSAPGALGGAAWLSSGLIWRWQEAAHQLRSEGEAALPALRAICSHVCPKESGALTVTERPRALSYHRDGLVHMTREKAAALRRADMFCVERPGVDVVAAQMLLEYQDKCARLHMCTRPQTFKAVSGQLLRVMLLSAIIRLTLKMPPPPRQAHVNSRPLWPAVMETLELTAFGSTGRRARACLREGVFDREASWPVNWL